MDSKISLNLVKNWQQLCNDIVFYDIAPSLLQKQIVTVKEYQFIASQPDMEKMENFLLLLLKKNETILMKFAESLEKDYSWLAEKITDGCKENIKEEGKDEVDAIPIMETDSRKCFENDTTTEDEKDNCMDCDNLNSINKTNLNNRININSAKLQRRRKKVLKSRIKNSFSPKVENSEAIKSAATELLKPELNDEVTDEAITIIKNCSLLSKSWTTIAHSLGLTDRVHDIRFKVILHGEDLNMCVVYLIKNWLEMFPKIATLSKLIQVLRSENFNRVADQLMEIQYRKPTVPGSGIQ